MDRQSSGAEEQHDIYGMEFTSPGKDQQDDADNNDARQEQVDYESGILDDNDVGPIDGNSSGNGGSIGSFDAQPEGENEQGEVEVEGGGEEEEDGNEDGEEEEEQEEVEEDAMQANAAGIALFARVAAAHREIAKYRTPRKDRHKRPRKK
jgi:hypothetical protein